MFFSLENPAYQLYVRRIEIADEIVVELDNIQVVSNTHAFINSVNVVKSATNSRCPSIDVASKI